MRTVTTPLPVLELERLIRKSVLLLLLVAAYALSMVLFLTIRPSFWQALRWTLSVLLLGLLSGFAARLLFYRRNGLIRSMAAVASFVAGMLICGYASGASIGFDVARLMGGNISWLDLGGMVIGVMIAMTALWAWHRPVSRVTKAVSAPRPVSSGFFKSKATRQPAQIRQSVKRRLEHAPALEAISIVKPVIAERPLVNRKPKWNTGKTLRPRPKGLLRRKPKVQLAVVEEHRCPYCLEPVSRDDPRGVVECEICHSLHHKDCWDITGTCQVPHLNQ